MDWINDEMMELMFQMKNSCVVVLVLLGLAQSAMSWPLEEILVAEGNPKTIPANPATILLHPQTILCRKSLFLGFFGILQLFHTYNLCYDYHSFSIERLQGIFLGILKDSQGFFASPVNS